MNTLGYPANALPVGATLLACNPLDVPDEYIDSFDAMIWQQFLDSPFIEKEQMDGFTVPKFDDIGNPVINWEKLEEWRQLLGEHTLGNSANAVYNNIKRSQYMDKCKNTANSYLKKFDLIPTEATAYEAYMTRQTGRAASQKPITPGSRYMSQKIEVERSFKDIFDKSKVKLIKGTKKSPPIPNPTNEQVWREVVKSSGKSNSSLRLMNKFTKVLGPIGLASGIYSSYNNIKYENYTYESIVGETTAFTLGFVGFDVGMVIGTAAVIGLAALLAVTAPAWAILTGAIAGGFLLGVGLAWVGRKAGRFLGSWFD